MACVYILFSKRKQHFYKGSSRHNDAQKRLKAHNEGKVRSTKSGLPWELLYVEECLDYSVARKREIFLKSGKGRRWIKEKFEK